MRHFCLNLHADYLCRHAGACCTAGWAIPAEAPVYESLIAYFGDRFQHPLFRTGGPLPEGAAGILNTRPDGDCVFFEASRGRLCAIHRELGAAQLPAACRHFPRVVLQDARGTLISMSHYCPTAAELLLSPDAPRVVEAPRSLTLDGDLEGLDARGTLPPLLATGMLTDDDGYAAWEERAIEVLGRDDLTAEQALDLISAATRNLQTWRPGETPLRDAVQREFERAAAHGAFAHGADENLESDVQRFRLALQSIPDGLAHPEPLDDYRDRWRDVSPWWPDHDKAVRRYLAARLFGNWMAYYGAGLHAIVEYLRLALAVLKMEAARNPSSSASAAWHSVIPAVRNADLLLVHLSDTKALSRLLA
jgi:Fe-S-cluster containining protein